MGLNNWWWMVGSWYFWMITFLKLSGFGMCRVGGWVGGWEGFPSLKIKMKFRSLRIHKTELQDVSTPLCAAVFGIADFQYFEITEMLLVGTKFVFLVFKKN